GPLLSPEMLLILIVQGLIFWQVGLYRGVWRFASIADLVNIMTASLFGLLAILPPLFFVFDRAGPVPRTVVLAYPVVLTALLRLPRLRYRAWTDHGSERTDKAALRSLLLGAGQAGEALVRDVRRVGAYVPVGFLDDAAKLGGS